MSMAQSNKGWAIFYVNTAVNYWRQLRGLHYHPHTTNQLDHTRDQAKQTNQTNQSIQSINPINLSNQSIQLIELINLAK